MAWDLRGWELSTSCARLYNHFLLSTTGPFTAEETEAQTVICLRLTAGKVRWLELVLRPELLLN